MDHSDTDIFESPTDWYQFCRYLEAENRFILIPRWEKFINAVLRTAEKRVQVLKREVILARARIGVEEIEDEKYDFLVDSKPLPPEEMGAPPSLAAKDGRINPHGISYLYLANSVVTAIAEARPWVGADVSVGYFRLLRDQKLVNTSKDKKFIPLPLLGRKYSEQEKEKGVWGGINESFSRPVCVRRVRGFRPRLALGAAAFPVPFPTPSWQLESLTWWNHRVGRDQVVGSNPTTPTDHSLAHFRLSSGTRGHCHPRGGSLEALLTS